MQATSTIKITECSRGLQISIPFDLKDHFRSAFRTATWESAYKTWLVKDTKITRNKLDKYVEAVEASGVLAALQNKEELEASQKDIEKWTQDLASRKASIEAMAAAVKKENERYAAVNILIERFKALAPELQAAQEKQAVAASKAQDAVAVLREKVDALLTPFGDAFSTMEQLETDWKRLSYGKWSYKEDIHRAQVRLKTIYETIERETGVQLHALFDAYDCNTNRVDRDSPSRELARLYSKITFPKSEE